jgi:hypothetical protein
MRVGVLGIIEKTTIWLGVEGIIEKTTLISFKVN